MPLFLGLAILSGVAEIYSTRQTVLVELAAFLVVFSSLIVAGSSVGDRPSIVTAVVDSIGEGSNLG